MSRSRLLLLPLVWLLALTLPHLGQGDYRRDTGRYAAVGLYMWSEGPLLQPHLDPQTPYFNKPPMALWIHGLFLKIFGVHLSVARIPSILAALGVVVLSVLTARQLGSHSEALVSGLVLALTYEFFRRTREISLDFWQLLFLMAAAYVVVRGARLGKRSFLAAAGVPVGLALLCKPLVGLLAIPLFAIWLWLLGERRLLKWLLLGTLPLALVVALPWHLYMYAQFGSAFTHHYLKEQAMDRAKGLMGSQPPLYYVQSLLKGYWPWLAAVAFAIYLRLRSPKPARHAQRDLVVLGGTWVLYWLTLLSLFPAKQVNYALPLYPMLSWVSAAGLCRIPWPALRTWYRRGLTGALAGALAVLVIASVAPIRFQRPPDPDWAALFHWLDENHIDSRRIAQRGLEADDVCYFYVKRRQWLPSIFAASADSSQAGHTQFILTMATPNQLINPQTVAFHSHDLLLLRNPESQSPVSSH